MKTTKDLAAIGVLVGSAQFGALRPPTLNCSSANRPNREPHRLPEGLGLLGGVSGVPLLPPSGLASVLFCMLLSLSSS